MYEIVMLPSTGERIVVRFVFGGYCAWVRRIKEWRRRRRSIFARRHPSRKAGMEVLGVNWKEEVEEKGRDGGRKEREKERKR